MSYAHAGAFVDWFVFAKLLNYNYRIIVFDGDKHDRALLALALRSALPHAEVLEAASAVEVAHHVSAGPVDALIADPVARFGELISLLLDLRKRYPACLCLLFSGDGSLPSLRDCVGRGVDGRFAKTSAGFLELPKALSERLRWYAELRDRLPTGSETIFSSVFPGATCLISEQGSLLMVSEEFERLVEQPRFGLLGQQFAQFWMDADKREEWQARMARPPRSWDFIGRFRCPRPDKPVMAMSIRMLGSEPGGSKLWAASMTDVSGMATVNQPPAEVTTDEETGNLIFSLSHDLQAPLNSLNAHSAALASALGDSSGEVATTVQEIGDLTTRMQDMLNSVVEYSMPESSAAKREIVNLDIVLEAALSNLRANIDLAAATIEHDPLPTLAVDTAQMTRVFQNLIANAIKFCGERIPRIRVSAEETTEFLRIRFEDNGIGIDPANSERIFTMFQRLHSEQEYAGVGAGLAICRRIVRAHGGDIRVESNPGRGSSFILEFRGAAVRTLNAGNAPAEALG